MNTEYTPQGQQTEDEIDLIDLWIVIWRGKWLVILLTVIAAVGSIFYSLSLEPQYKTSATFLPVSGESGSSMGEYSQLAQMAGINVSTKSTPAQKIMAILKSRTIIEKVVRELELTPVLVEEPPEDRTPFRVAVEALMEMLDVSQNNDTGVIAVSLEYKDPDLTTEIVNYTVKVLSDLLNEKSITVSKKNRVLLEKQLALQENKLDTLQDKLVEYQTSSKMVNPSRQIESTMALYSQLITQRINLEIQIAKLQSALSEDNPKIVALNEQLDAIRKQITKLEQQNQSMDDGSMLSLNSAPSTLVEYQNILRELEITQQIYISLLSLYERTKLEESEDALFIELLDPAIVPEQPSAPNKKMIVMVATATGGFLSIFLVFLITWIKNARPRYKEKLKEFEAQNKGQHEGSS